LRALVLSGLVHQALLLKTVAVCDQASAATSGIRLRL
jgi:hypothetical protein